MVAPTPRVPSSTLAPLLLLTLAAVVNTGEALQCYVCSSEISKNCEDPFNSDSVPKMSCTPEAVKKSMSDATKALSDVLTKFGVDIPQGTMAIEFVCQKMKRTNKDGDQVVLRSCAFNPEAVNSCPPTNVECVQCNSDLCNGAPGGHEAAATGVPALLLLLYSTGRLLRP